MGTESKKIVKLNGMEMCDEIRAKILFLRRAIPVDCRWKRPKFYAFSIRKGVLEGLDYENNWWGVFPFWGQDDKLLEFLKEKFPEYLI